MMHEFFSGPVPVHAMAMCILMNVFMVLSIAALIKYIIKGRCGSKCGCKCGCACCNKGQESGGTEKSGCCK